MTTTVEADLDLKVLRNYVDGTWVESSGERLEVMNPGTGAPHAQVPLSTRDELEAAVGAAHEAKVEWRRTPIAQRARYVAEYGKAIAARHEEVSQTIAMDVGKTIAEARAEVTRALEAFDGVGAIPFLARGTIAEDVARGVEAHTIRQPVGVVAVISPFNFPLFSTCAQQATALTCGNTVVWKPSEQTPLANELLFEIISGLGLPNGVWNLVHGGREVVEAMCDSDRVNAVSFVGSATVAEEVYRRATASGKRVQALGGAKNYMVVMPDALMDDSATQIVQSGFGSAGQRCMAGSVVICVGGSWQQLRGALLEKAQGLKVGDPRDEEVTLGPVVSRRALDRIEEAIEGAVGEGGQLALDGRDVSTDADGFFVGPTVVENVRPSHRLATDEIFGPVLAIMEVETLDDAIETVNDSPYGNGTSLFTESGAAVAKYRAEVEVGMIGVNLGVAAPVSLFPFTGWGRSFFGDLPIQAEASVEFCTRRKTVTARYRR